MTTRTPLLWGGTTPVSSTNLNKSAAGWVMFSVVTTSFNVVTSHTPHSESFTWRDDRKYMLSYGGPPLLFSAAGGVEVRMFIDAATVAVQRVDMAASGYVACPSLMYVYSPPSTASRSCSIQFQIVSGTPTVTFGAVSTAASSFIAVDVGPSS